MNRSPSYDGKVPGRGLPDPAPISGPPQMSDLRRLPPSQLTHMGMVKGGWNSGGNPQISTGKGRVKWLRFCSKWMVWIRKRLIGTRIGPVLACPRDTPVGCVSKMFSFVGTSTECELCHSSPIFSRYPQVCPGFPFGS